MPPVTPAAHDVSVLTLNDSYVATLASHCNDALEPSSLLITEGAGDEAAADDWDIDASLLKNENDDDDDADNDYDDDDTAVNDNDDSNVRPRALVTAHHGGGGGRGGRGRLGHRRFSS